MSNLQKNALCLALQGEATNLRKTAKGVASAFLAAALLLTALLFSASGAYAQLYTGTVSGVVTDPSNAAVPGATVTLTDADKGFTYKGTTDDQGRYLIRQVPPGNYALQVEATNFTTQKREGLKIDINQNVSADFSLKIGVAAEKVDVVAGAVQLQTEDAVTGQVVNRKFINDLPLVGRGVLDLAYLAPGIVETNECQGCSQNNFNSNGGRNATADILLDGVSSTNFEQNSGVQVPTYVPSVDAVEEFKVQQSNFTAEFGFSGGTILNVVTRSGTNEYHGTLYDFFRNQDLDANNWFSNANGEPRQPVQYNDFGGTIGGPIKKNKTFFFFDIEATRVKGFGSTTASVPTALTRTGDFGEVCSSVGGTFDAGGLCSEAAGQLWDPYSSTKSTDGEGNTVITRGAYIPYNNLITYASPGNAALNGTPYQVANPGTAGNLIDPIAQRLMNFFPLPNTGDEGQLQNNWFSAGTSKSFNNQFDIKIDHRFTEATQISAKYAHQWGDSHSFACPAFSEADPCTSGAVKSTANLFSLNLVHTFSPTLVLTLQYGFTRGAVDQPGITSDYPNIDPVTDLGLPSYMNVSGYKQFPQIGISDYTPAGPGGAIGTQYFTILREGQETHHFGGAIGWNRGSHDMKFGAEMRIHRINFTQPGWPGGEFDFGPTFTSENPNDEGSGGDGMASFLMGIGNGGEYEVPNNVATQNFQFGGFVQDNYKASRNLTFNLGLRYEVVFPRTERFNRMNYLDPNLQVTLQPNADAPDGTQPITVTGAEVFVSPSDRYNYDVNYHGWQPRFGFAWQAAKGFVIRGGYGIYFSTPRSGAAGTGPWGYQGYDQQTSWISSFNNQGVLPGPRFSDPFPGTGPKLPPGNSLGSLNDIGTGAAGPIKSISNSIPYEQNWSFGFQKELPWKVLLDASYVGKKGTHLYFGGFRDQNHLGPQVEQLSTADLSALALDDVPNPYQYYVTDPLAPLAGPTIHPYQDPGNDLHVPFTQFTSFSGDSPPIANSIYHAAQIRLEKPFSNGLQFLVTYTFSKSIDGASATDDSISWLGGGFQGGTIGVQNPNNLRAERAVSVFDIPQVLQFSYVYALPIGRGRKFGNQMNPVLNAVVGGWQVNGIWRFDNGRPLIFALANSTPIPTYGQRPTLTGPLQKNTGSIDSRLQNYFANACDESSDSSCTSSVLIQTPDYTLGNAPRTITNVRAPGQRNASMSVFKEFPLGLIREGMRLEFRAEAFNVFNHVQFGAPDTVLGSGSFGTTTYTQNSPRELQLGLKLYF